MALGKIVTYNENLTKTDSGLIVKIMEIYVSNDIFHNTSLFEGFKPPYSDCEHIPIISDLEKLDIKLIENCSSFIVHIGTDENGYYRNAVFTKIIFKGVIYFEMEDEREKDQNVYVVESYDCITHILKLKKA